MFDMKMIDIKLGMTVSSSPPSNPDVGDMYIQEDGDELTFHVWDGDIWRDVIIGDPMEDPPAKKEPEDTPEKAYDRAMGVVR